MRARKGSTIGNKFGYLWMAAIPFNQNVCFKFAATSLQYQMEQHFRNIYPNFWKLSSGSFLSSFKFAPECLKFLVERFAFRKLFRKSGNFSGKILYQLPLFPKFLKFWVNGKRPKCIQEMLVLRESSARTATCKSVLHVHIRPIDLCITYNQPRVTSGYARFAWVFGTFRKITLRFAMNILFWFCAGMGHFAHFY